MKAGNYNHFYVNGSLRSLITKGKGQPARRESLLYD